MQVFVPYSNVFECAQALSADSKRFNKQIVECNQIINAMCGAKAWRNHPVTKMYEDDSYWLELYTECFITYKHDKQLALRISNKAAKYTPSFLTTELCNQHKRRLFTKAPNLYPQFTEFGTSEENWYFVDNKLVKYINGKKQ